MRRAGELKQCRIKRIENVLSRGPWCATGNRLRSRTAPIRIGKGDFAVRTLLKACVVLVTPACCLFVITRPGNAIPAFARQYATSCMTCHTVFPKLNDFGKAFKDAGFQFPKADESGI